MVGEKPEAVIAHWESIRPDGFLPCFGTRPRSGVRLSAGVGWGFGISSLRRVHGALGAGQDCVDEGWAKEGIR